MSPEQWRGDSDIDARVDIYAVGCMLYEMLSGHLPYIATTIHKMRLHHLESPIPQLDNMPSHINKIIRTCLEKERDRRYGSVQALLQELTLFYEANFGKLSPLIVNEIMNASDYNHRGGTYFGLKKYELALTDFDEAIRLDPHYALAYMNRANLYLEKG